MYIIYIISEGFIVVNIPEDFQDLSHFLSSLYGTSFQNRDGPVGAISTVEVKIP